MSKANREFVVFFTILLIPHCFVNLYAQGVEATIKIGVNPGSVASVSGRNSDPRARGNLKNLSFLRSSVGIADLAARITDVDLIDYTGKSVAYKRFMAGEFVGETTFNQWSYKIDITAPKNSRAAAHVSWLSGDTGILMLDDLMPKFAGGLDHAPAIVTVEIPFGWSIFTAEKRLDGNRFLISDMEKAVFLIGKNTRERPVKIGRSDLNLVLSGVWKFDDEEAVRMAAEIYSDYSKIFGSEPTGRAQISIIKFPHDAGLGVWEAETRGRSVTIMSADMPFKTQSLQRLHEQLRHEIFHLWLPNAVNLSGNYDWFYEGFALYQSLKTGVQLNRIRFDDFLDTLSRAYTIDSVQAPGFSLIEASTNRFNGSETKVYARGMLVAFLCDLALLEKSKGKKSVSDIFQALFEKHRFPSARQDGNTAILKVFREYTEISPIVVKYISGNAKIDWRDQLEAAGIETEPENPRTNLRVKIQVNGRQNALLDKLGYNNWRKLSGKSN